MSVALDLTFAALARRPEGRAAAPLPGPAGAPPDARAEASA
jgi:hypothetical protein